MWQDASSGAGAIFIHIQLLLPRNNFIANHHLLAEAAVPSCSSQLFSYGTADQELAAQSTEGKKVKNTGQGEEVHLSPGFGQTDLHNRTREPPPTAASVVCARRKAFSFLAIFFCRQHTTGAIHRHIPDVGRYTGRHESLSSPTYSYLWFDSYLKARVYAKVMRQEEVYISSD